MQYRRGQRILTEYDLNAINVKKVNWNIQKTESIPPFFLQWQVRINI